MTYIIAEPCIDIKDRSCVDVCPVDCIHEAERILVIDPEECIDCFPADETLLTARGLRTFAQLENRSCRVLTDDGFKPAFVRRFRRRPLVEVELAPAFVAGGDRRSGYRRLVHATATHGWVLADGERTDGLAAGDAVPAARLTPARDSERYRLGVLHGLVYGDGSATSDDVGGEHVHRVDLYGEQRGRFAGVFDEVRFSPSLDIRPGYAGTGVVRAAANLTRTLPESADTDYLGGFVDGWLAAGGDADSSGSWRVRSTDHAALAWLERVAPVAGFVVVGSGRDVPASAESRPARWLHLTGRETSWRVTRVTPLERDAEDTFCAVVPRKHEFTLAGGVYTRNCGACEPECPVEAIFPEDALPEKWDAFVKINYAYSDGMDLVNKLTDEYATEHNVQNEPIE